MIQMYHIERQTQPHSDAHRRQAELSACASWYF